jgi:hypothetical protein
MQDVDRRGVVPRARPRIREAPHAMRFAPRIALACAAALALSATALAQEDTGPQTPTFKEGDVVTFDEIESLKPFLPAEFWSNRDFFFYEGMQLEIGPFYRDYAPSDAYLKATAKYGGQAKIGPEASLESYVAGQPFPMDKIDCKGDPQAGAKIIWNFDQRWDGMSTNVGNGKHTNAGYYYSYWDRGEELPLYYEGTARFTYMAHRPEPEYEATGGDVFRGDKRKHIQGIEVDAPFDARGIMLITYRYKASEGPKATSKNDDTWVYVPTLRRVRRISSAQRTDAVSGTDFTFDDLFSFFGLPPQYKWECLGEMDIIAPLNTKVKAYPYSRDHNFGPYGLSYADDRWELRHAVKIRFVPNNADHPYSYKDIYVDKQTLNSMYAFAYDRKKELWKIIWHNHRWSEDQLGDETPREYYPSWPGVDVPRDNLVISDTIVNVQTGTGNRIEYWDRNGTPLKSKGQLRRYIDVGRLTKGR